MKELGEDGFSNSSEMNQSKPWPYHDTPKQQSDIVIHAVCSPRKGKI